MKKCLCFLLCVFAFNIFAAGTFTKLQSGVTLYSEYYPNPLAKFKGTIIFENGSGTDITEWKSNRKFFDCIKQMGSVFLYDRNGLGKSPPDLLLSPSNPLTAKLVNDKLTSLLQQLDIKPPYIVIAHSYGAMYGGYFSLKHSNLVKGLLLIDPVPKEFNFSHQLSQQYQAGLNEAKSKSASYIYKKYGGSKAEVLYQLLGMDASKRSIKQLGNINDAIPIIILSSTGMEKEHPLIEDWYESQKQWLNKNPKSKIVRISSYHFIQLSNSQKVCSEFKHILNN